MLQIRTTHDRPNWVVQKCIIREKSHLPVTPMYDVIYVGEGTSADVVPFLQYHSGHDPSLRGLAAIHDDSMCSLSEVARQPFVQLSVNAALMKFV